MDDVFVNHECQSTRCSHSAKNKNKQTQSKTTFATCLLLCLFVCSFFHMPVLYLLSSCLFVTLFVSFSCNNNNKFNNNNNNSFVCFLNAFPIRFV